MSGVVPRRAAFDDLRVGQLVVWLGDDNVLGTITDTNPDGQRVILDSGAFDIPGVVGEWVILRDAPAAPVTVRRAEWDAFRRDVDYFGCQWQGTDAPPARLLDSARALIANAEGADA